MSNVRSLEELMNVENPGWDYLLENLHSDAVIFPLENEEEGQQTLYELQVTARSFLGAIGLHCAGIAFHHGWVRILGAGNKEFGIPGIRDFNDMSIAYQHGIIVGYDLAGGLYALNNGGISPDNLGEIYYYAPDTLKWEHMNNMKFSDLIFWLSGDQQQISQYYTNYAWDGWEEEIKKLSVNEGIGFYPHPSTVEGQDKNSVSRSAIPIDELINFNFALQNFYEQAGVQDGEQFGIEVTE